MRTITKLVTTAAASTMLLVGVATTADAATVSNCRGVRTGGTAVHVVVPAGATCSLTRVTVRGSITVRTGATLIMDHSSVSGRIVAKYADAVSLNATVINGTITASGMPSGSGAVNVPNARPVLVQLTGWSRTAGITGKGMKLVLNRADVRGPVTGTWGDSTTITNATVRGAASFTNNYGGHVTACGSSFRASVTISTGRFGALLGNGCQGNTFASKLTVTQMTGVRVSNNLIKGAAAGVNFAFMAPTGVVGSDNTFQGSRSGDFADAALG